MLLCVVPYCDRLYCYAVSGDDVAYGATHSLCGVRDQPSVYRYTMCCTELRYAATHLRPYAATRCVVLTQRMLLPVDHWLFATADDVWTPPRLSPYAMPGTNVAYAARRMRCAGTEIACAAVLSCAIVVSTELAFAGGAVSS
eukprot:3543582-Rhodomonas_salina.1